MPQPEIEPLVSVLMSVYNGQRYLSEAIESILDQTFGGFEFIIVDDGSSDDTWEILERYARLDARLTLVHNDENIGLTRALNQGLALARGKYIARQDADDVALPRRLEKQVRYLEQHPQAVLVSCNLEVIDAQGRTVDWFQRDCEPELVAWYLLFYNRLAGHSQVLFRRETALALGGYAEDLRYSQDYELWLRFTGRGQIVILPEVLQKWRRHEGSISGTVTREQHQFQLDVSREHLSRLAGYELDPVLAAELRGLWTDRFPSAAQAAGLHSLLQQIVPAFLEDRAGRDSPDTGLSIKLRVLVAEQFLRWSRYLSLRREPVSKVRVSLLAFRWHPLGAAGFWARYPGSVIRRQLRAWVHQT